MACRRKERIVDIQEFPKYKYHRTLTPRVVANPEEEADLGPGWANHPNDLLEAEPVEPEAPTAEAGEPAEAEAKPSRKKPKKA